MLSRADDSAIRKLRSFGYFDTGNDNTRNRVVTFRDYPLAIELSHCNITREHFEAGERFFETWRLAGLSGALKSPGWEKISSDINGDAGMALNDEEAYYRGRYRAKVQAMGLICANVVEWVVCWKVQVPVLARRFPGFHSGQQWACETETRKRLKIGLERLVGLDK